MTSLEDVKVNPPTAQRAREIPIRQLPLQSHAPSLAACGIASVRDGAILEPVYISSRTGRRGVDGAGDGLGRQFGLGNAELVVRD